MGSVLRADMSTKGRALKDDHKSRLAELQKSEQEATSLKEERESLKKKAEDMENAALEVYRAAKEIENQEKSKLEAAANAKEAEETFKKYDSNGNGIIEIAEIQTRVAFDRNRDGEVTEDEAKYFLDDHDQVDFDTFSTLCWPKIKPYLMLDSGLFKPPATVDELKNPEIITEGDGGEPDLDHAGGEDEEYEPEVGEGDVCYYSIRLLVFNRSFL